MSIKDFVACKVKLSKLARDVKSLQQRVGVGQRPMTAQLHFRLKTYYLLAICTTCLRYTSIRSSAAYLLAACKTFLKQRDPTSPNSILDRRDSVTPLQVVPFFSNAPNGASYEKQFVAPQQMSKSTIQFNECIVHENGVPAESQ